MKTIMLRMRMTLGGIDSEQHCDFLDKYTRQDGSEKVDMEELTKCLNVMLYGSDFDGDGNIDCEQKLYEMSPIVLMEAVACIDDGINEALEDKNVEVAKDHSCLDYLFME